MMNALVIPIHLDALCLSREFSAVKALADFSKLPYFNGRNHQNAGIPYLGESAVSPPFHDENSILQAGVHLHWSLPRALTKTTEIRIIKKAAFLEAFPAAGTAGWNAWAASDEFHRIDDHTLLINLETPGLTLGAPLMRWLERQARQFPPVPDSWIVRREFNGKQKTWLVMGRRLHFDPSQSAAFLLPNSNTNGAQFQYLGESIEYGATTLLPPEAISYLSAIGYGDPGFAAFYPNCRNVFGFHDAEIAGELQSAPKTTLANLSYEVFGSYSQPDLDFLKLVLKNRSAEDAQAYLKEKLMWETGAELTETPKALVCRAKLAFNTPEGIKENHRWASGMKLTLANTGTEALSAHLAWHIANGDDDRKQKIEEQLEALHQFTKLDHLTLDVSPKFREGRHERTFNAVPGGTIWTLTLRSDDNPQPAEVARTTTSDPLPAAFLAMLGVLNQFQRDYDQALSHLESIREQIYFDWYAYMLCAYRPRGSRVRYPDPDPVRVYIEKVDLKDLDDQLAAVEDLKEKLTAQIGKINEALNGIDMLYQLKPKAAPRYWEPKEPVLLLAGEAARPTVRHAHSGQKRKTESLSYEVFSIADDESLIDTILGLSSLSEEDPGYTNWTEQPWHPLFLEWKIKLHPPLEGGNVYSHNNRYQADFISRNYQLQEQKKDLTGRPLCLQSARIFTGRSILTPNANVKLEFELESYFQRHLTPNDFSNASAAGRTEFEGITEFDELVENGMAETFIHYYLTEFISKNQINGISTTLEDGSQSIDYESLSRWCLDHLNEVESPEAFELNHLVNLMAIYSVLNEHQVLSQALSGFNAAMLMRKQTLLLPIDESIGFEEYRKGLTQDLVRRAVADCRRVAPDPFGSFNPIRAGKLEILDLRLVDVFGRVKDLGGALGDLHTTGQLSAHDGPGTVWMPPRIVQPARMDFRWLEANPVVDPGGLAAEPEMSELPGSSPILGWFLPNNLDGSLMVYGDRGQSLGALVKHPDGAAWEPAPGADGAENISEIPAGPLQRTVQMIKDLSTASGNADKVYLDYFLDALENALERIDPEGFAQHQAQAILLGRPIALVRARIKLKLKELPAVNQSIFTGLPRDMAKEASLLQRERDGAGFTSVKFPVRLGEYHQLNDGLAGYWIERDDGSLDDIFYAPQSDVSPALVHPKIRGHTHSNASGNGDHPSLSLDIALDDDPLKLTILMDPRAKLHATSGILPAKVIDIPAEQYTDALKAIEVTFFTAPVLGPRERVHISLPEEAGFSWSWLEKDLTAAGEETWREIAQTGMVNRTDVTALGGAALWDELKSKNWVKEINDRQARVLPADQRTELDATFADRKVEIEHFLDRTHLGAFKTQAHFDDPLKIREGWLKLKRKP